MIRPGMIDEWNKVVVKTFSARPGPSALLEYCKIRPGFDHNQTIIIYYSARAGRFVCVSSIRMALCFTERKTEREVRIFISPGFSNRRTSPTGNPSSSRSCWLNNVEEDIQQSEAGKEFHLS